MDIIEIETYADFKTFVQNFPNFTNLPMYYVDLTGSGGAWYLYVFQLAQGWPFLVFRLVVDSAPASISTDFPTAWSAAKQLAAPLRLP